MPKKKILEELVNAMREYNRFLSDEEDETDEEKERFRGFMDVFYMKSAKMIVKGININDENKRDAFYKKEKAKIEKWATREINKIKKQDTKNKLSKEEKKKLAEQAKKDITKLKPHDKK